MQFGFILLVLVAVLHGSSNVVSASISADATLGRVGVASVGGKGARSLRTSENGAHGYGASDNEERAGNAVAEKAPGFFARVFGLGKPATSTTSDVTKTVASAPKVDEKWEALKAEGEVLMKLARSKSISEADAHLAASVKKNGKELNLKQFKYFDEDLKTTPDDMIERLHLDPKVASEMTSKRSVEHLDDTVFGEYMLWFRYFKYYTKTHEGWKSELATPVLRKQATT